MCELIVSGYVASNIGLKHRNNEDNYLMNQCMNENASAVSGNALNQEAGNPYWNWAAVLDGMGNGQNGEKASQITAEELRRSLRKIQDRVPESELEHMVRQGFLNANGRIVKEREHCSILGSTATLFCFCKNKAKLFYLGDSRAYLLREKRLYQLTIDQTLANLKISAGMMNAESPEAERDRHLLTEYVGADETMTSLKPQESKWITLKELDKILLCSDGLHHLCSDEEIKEILLSDSQEVDMANRLVQSALNKGGTDNVTCLVLTVKRESSQTEVTEDGH